MLYSAEWRIHTFLGQRNYKSLNAVGQEVTILFLIRLPQEFAGEY